MAFGWLNSKEVAGVYFSYLRIVFLFIILALTGCATKQELYYWGSYEQLVYNTYLTPGAADPVTQIERIKVDIQKSEASGKKVPPGIFAHLGFLYAVQGNVALSQEAFMEERSLYPESSVFIDGMLNRAKQNEEQ